MPPCSSTKKTCTIPGCGREHNARGWCQAHYKRWVQHGDPLGESFPWPGRFWRKVVRTESCWLWTGATGPDGYGRSSDDSGAIRLAHRIAYVLSIGPIPDDRPHLDHLCRIRRCVRPDHLEPVTQRVNNQRASTKDFCLRRHSLTDPANLYHRPNRPPECRECVRIRARESYRRKLDRR